ncbi:MAG: DUF177 domain-containing protein [Acidimicrobiia bacterium]|nr:DUF177 domain-containing protein [Acidimicrobiia bacterium]
MAESSPFIVDASDLLKDVGRTRPVQISASVEWGTEFVKTPADSPLQADLELQSISGGVMTNGRVAFEAEFSCSRCLTERRLPQEIRITQLFGDDPDAEYQLSGEDIDLEPMLRDEVVLAMPLRPLCRDDCAGLCPSCGADLNEGSCPGHEEATSSPFAELREMLETQE